jgi:hypothetical protein
MSQVAEYRQGGRVSLQQLVAELDRQRESRVDFVADSRLLHIANGTDDDPRLRLQPADTTTGEWLDPDGVPINDAALPQVCRTPETETPIKFARKMIANGHGDLLATSLSALWHREPKKRFVRMLDGRVRGVLSNRYRVLDNYDLAFNALELAKTNNAEVVECNITPTKMRIKMVDRNVWSAIDDVQRGGNQRNWYAGGLGNADYLGQVGAKTRGDLPGGPGTIHPSITITNSETGHGGLSVRIGILRAICFNLATVEDVASHVHLGGAMDDGIYTEETLSADSKAIMLKIRDSITTAFDAERFEKLVAKCKEANVDRIDAATDAVDMIAGQHSMAQMQRDSILEHFLSDYDRTRYGLAQAIARHAQDVASCELAAELETISGHVLTHSLSA